VEVLRADPLFEVQLTQGVAEAAVTIAIEDSGPTWRYRLLPING